MANLGNNNINKNNIKYKLKQESDRRTSLLKAIPREMEN